MDTGVETITNRAEEAQVRRQARMVHAKALVVAMMCTGIALLV